MPAGACGGMEALACDGNNVEKRAVIVALGDRAVSHHLKYLKLGGAWFGFDGISSPSALSM